MKRTAFLLAIGMFIAACSSGTVVNERNSNGRSNSVPVPGQGNASPSVAPAAALGERTGEKVGEPRLIDFRDGLPVGWEKIDPDSESQSVFDTSGGVLRLQIPTGKDLFGENRTAPRLVRRISGDFEIETRLKFKPKSDYQGAGLIIFRNDNNYLRLERCFGGVGGGGSGIRFDRAEDENYEGVATPEKFPTSVENVELKLRRQGRVVTAFWRESGTSTWTEIGKVSNTYPETVVVGVLGVNTGEEIAAEFAFLKLTPIGR